ncbi:MAG: hypothetical protein ABI333_28810 [bacterium]
MDPFLSWVVCILSAFLLAAGGFLLARSLAARHLGRRLEDLAKLKTALRTLSEERDKALHGEKEALRRMEASQELYTSSAADDRDGFGGPTELPRPASYFDRHSVPHMQRVADDEFEIPDAGMPSAEEVHRRGGEVAHAPDPQDQTRQVNLHSPENVVQFMQRIDELNDENSDLRAALDDREQQLKERRVEGNEQVHRAAALDANVEKLRAELKRRNDRIRQLEAKMDGQLASESGAFAATTASRAVPPPPPLGVRGPPRKLGGPHDGPTLEVRRVSESELSVIPGPKDVK